MIFAMKFILQITVYYAYTYVHTAHIFSYEGSQVHIYLNDMMAAIVSSRQKIDIPQPM